MILVQQIGSNSLSNIITADLTRGTMKILSELQKYMKIFCHLNKNSFINRTILITYFKSHNADPFLVNAFLLWQLKT